MQVPVSDFGTTVLALATTFVFLAVVTVGLRVWAYHIRSRPWKDYDTLIVISAVFQLALLVTLFYGVFYGGLGNHMHDSHMSATVVSKLFKAFIGQSLTWVISTTIIKISILLFYLDIFRFSHGTRKVLWAFVVFVAAYGVASILCVFTICRPFSRMWNQDQPGRCGNIMSAMFATAVINCLEDLAVVIIPMPIIWKLQMSKQKKLGLSAVIAAGFVIFGINIARLALASPKHDNNPSYNLAYQALFINLEVHIGVIIACLPLIKPLFNRNKYTKTNTYAAQYLRASQQSGGRYTPMSERQRLSGGRTPNEATFASQESWEISALKNHDHERKGSL